MENSRVFKVVIMEDCLHSSCVWVQFIKAEKYTDIKQYVNNSDCKLLYIRELTTIEIEFLDKGIDELKNGKMIYHKNK